MRPQKENMRCLQCFHKAKIYIISALVFCLLLPGCISPAEFLEEPSGRKDASQEAAMQFPDYVFDPENTRFSYGGGASIKEDGYYLVINYSLYFYDVQADTVFPICTKASCLHKDETCDAYIYDRGNWGFNGEGEDFIDGWASNAAGGKIFYYQDHLYMIACNPSKGHALMQYSPVFTEQKKIVWLSDFEAEPRILPMLSTLLFHHGYVYYLSYRYDIDTAWGNPDYQTTFTLCRFKLEEKAELEELFSFDYHYLGESYFRIGALQDEIYVMINYLRPSGRTAKNEEGMEIRVAEFVAGFGRVYRYDEKKNQSELIWSYDGDQPVTFFEAEGTISPNNSGEYLINAEGDYVYFAGFPEHEGEQWDSTKIASINLVTREGKVLYETPYERISQLKTDGKYYYFFEDGKEQTFLTAIDKEGNPVRRYEIPYSEKYIKEMEDLHWPREDWVKSHFLGLTITDRRYLVLIGEGSFKNLSSSMDGYNVFKYNSVIDGVGVLNTEDFLSGKDIEIRQIYERTDPFN